MCVVHALCRNCAVEPLLGVMRRGHHKCILVRQFLVLGFCVKSIDEGFQKESFSHSIVCCSTHEQIV